jgi:hypothetical protein
MDNFNNRKGKEKNVKKDKGSYKYGNKRVRQVENLYKKKTGKMEKDDNKKKIT